MKPGTLIVYPARGQAFLGRLVQPLVFAGERRWSVDWVDGFSSGSQTFPESDLLRVVPQ
jgi:hypothetical protein